MFRSRWQPAQGMWDHLNQLQTEMNRLFSRWGNDNGHGASGFPAVNVWEDGDALHVEAELPGLDLKDLEIYVTGQNQLTIKGERKALAPEKGIKHRQERGFGSFVRVLDLPFAVDPANVEAKLENGILNLKLAKHASAKPRKIVVKAN